MNLIPVLPAVKSDRLTAVRARVASAPSTYSCRVSIPAPTPARQMFLPESASDQPVTALAPLMTGTAPSAARHVTVYPLEPESAAVSRSGAESRYTPPASSTTMSPDIPAFSARTAACTADSAHGWAEVQAVPLPDGAAWRVVVAASAGAGAIMTNAAASTAVTRPITVGLGGVTGEGEGTVVPPGGGGAGLPPHYRQILRARQGIRRAYLLAPRPHPAISLLR